MKNNGFNKELQDRINKYVKFVHESEDQNCPKDWDLLSILSNNLKEEVAKHINGKYVNQSPIFQKMLSQGLKSSLPLYLDERIASPGEFIYTKFDIDHALFMISKGKVHLHYENFSQPLAYLQKGTYFGIESFFTDEARTKQATSVEFSHLIYITRSRFLEILEKYPVDKENFFAIKDKARLYNDYSRLYVKCYICSRHDHRTIFCSQIHYVTNREQVIWDYLKEKQRFAKEYCRRARKSLNALKDLDIVQRQAQKLQLTLGINNQDNNAKDLIFAESKESEADKTTNGNQKEADQISSEDIPLQKQPRMSKVRIIANKNGVLNSFDAEIMNKITELANNTSINELIIDEKYLEQENIEFDRMKNYEIYFPHNNFVKIFDFKVRNKKRCSVGTVYENQNLIERMSKILTSKTKKKANLTTFLTGAHCYFKLVKLELLPTQL